LTQPLPFLTEPQWHQETSPCLCPLWLQGQSRLSFVLSWQPFTMSSALHAGIVASCCQARWCRSSPVPEHTTYRDPRSCLLEAGCIRNNVPACRACPYHAPSHFGSGVSANFTCSASRPVIAGSLRQQRNQVWSVNPCLAQSRRTVVPGLPTLTSATPERRPGRPYTVVHV